MRQPRRANLMTVIETDQLPACLVGISGVSLGQSAFGTSPALWAGGKEICHRDVNGNFDIRLTRAVIRELRASFAGDARVTLRRSSASDWVEVACAGHEDEVLLRHLVERAAAAHPSPDGVTVPPPGGAELERRRRFH